MPQPTETTAATMRLAIDRIACTGKGACASIQPNAISLDEWGYPIIDGSRVEPALVDQTIRMCPARALYLAKIPRPQRHTARGPR